MSRFIPFLDLRQELQAIEKDLHFALDRVIKNGLLILGPQVSALECELAKLHGRRHAIAVASGTDALTLLFKSYNFPTGSKIVTTTLAPPPILAAIADAGMRPFPVDLCDHDLSIDIDALQRIEDRDVRILLAIDLFGRQTDTERLKSICEARGWRLLEDASQAILSTREGHSVGSFAEAAALSFYPTKNLGALGDGGAILTDSDSLAEYVRQHRDYGRVSTHEMQSLGRNSRLDELQANFLMAKLPYLKPWIDRRREIAQAYRDALNSSSLRPLPKDDGAIEHLFVVRTHRRDEVRVSLKNLGVGTAIHYPIPLHLQPAWKQSGYGDFELPVTKRASDELISLPMHAFLGDSEVEFVTSILKRFVVDST